MADRRDVCGFSLKKINSLFRICIKKRINFGLCQWNSTNIFLYILHLILSQYANYNNALYMDDYIDKEVVDVVI